MKNKKLYGLVAALVLVLVMIGCCAALYLGAAKQNALGLGGKTGQNGQKNSVKSVTETEQPSQKKQGDEKNAGNEDETGSADSSRQVQDEDEQDIIVRPAQGTGTSDNSSEISGNGSSGSGTSNPEENSKPEESGGAQTENPDQPQGDDVVVLPFVPID